jgi:hypothetical protein
VQFRNCDVKEFNRMSRSVSCGYVARKQTRQYDVEVFEDLAAECWQSHHQVPLVKRIGNNTHRWNSQELQGSPCASHWPLSEYTLHRWNSQELQGSPCASHWPLSELPGP